MSYVIIAKELLGDIVAIEIENKTIVEIENCINNYTKKKVFVILTTDWNGVAKIDTTNYLFEIFKVEG